ncbi:MAG: DUF2784 domain-containing protein [Proteobacteria bacterium]|nr:DUF2784 domain-containing protein [Pseudomonadota bacterium]
MLSQVLADLLVVIHFALIIFVMTGGFLVLRWRRIIFLHIPAALWGAFLELQGWSCPLTYLENHFREGETYHFEFIEYYITPLVYPSALTRQSQIFFGLAVLVINCVVYTWILVRYSRKKRRTNISS